MLIDHLLLQALSQEAARAAPLIWSCWNHNLLKEIQEGSLLYNKATTGEILKWEMTANQLFVHTKFAGQILLKYVNLKPNFFLKS